jgi:hypothetical protein
MTLLTSFPALDYQEIPDHNVLQFLFPHSKKVYSVYEESLQLL